MKANKRYLRTIVESGDTYIIRPVKYEDFVCNLSYCEELPDVSSSSVSFGLKPDNRKLNLFGIYDTDDARSSAFVAEMITGQDSQQLVGFAMHARNRERYSHEFYMSVEQSLATSSLPDALLRTLAQHAKDLGTESLFCHADSSNTYIATLSESTGMLVTLEPNQAHGLLYTLLLNNEKFNLGATA